MCTTFYYLLYYLFTTALLPFSAVYYLFYYFLLRFITFSLKVWEQILANEKVDKKSDRGESSSATSRLFWGYLGGIQEVCRGPCMGPCMGPPLGGGSGGRGFVELRRRRRQGSYTATRPRDAVCPDRAQ